MKTQTIFSDPMTANSIACAISRRSNQPRRSGFFRMLLGWARQHGLS